MFRSIENYDVQETRRISRQEGRQEGEAIGVEKGREGERKTALSNMKKSGLTPEQMSEYLAIPLEEVKRLLGELEQ